MYGPGSLETTSSCTSKMATNPSIGENTKDVSGATV